MKLVRFGPKGDEKPGIVDVEGNVRDLSAHISDITGATIGDVQLAKLAQIDPETLPKVEMGRYGPCVGSVGKFICIGLNYSDHAKGSGHDCSK